MSTPHQVEIVIHVDDALGDDQQAELIEDLRRQGGVEAAHFTPGRAHLLVVDYDRDQLSAQQVLERIRKEHMRAELIGPI